MTSELYLPIFDLLLSKARELENNPEFAKLLEQLYWAIISGPLQNTEISANDA